MESLLKQTAEKYVKFLSSDKDIKAVILTGSVARGDAIKDSDIDLLLIYDKLNKVQNDNIEWKTFEGKKIQLIKTTLEEIRKDIKIKEPFRISLLQGSVPLFDPKDYHKEIMKKLKNFSFDVNIKTRIGQAKDALQDALKAVKNNDMPSANLILDMFAFWMVRDYFLSKNNPHTIPKKMLAQLKKFDKEMYELYSKFLIECSVKNKIELFKKMINGLDFG